jgi:hypothetical protein
MGKNSIQPFIFLPCPDKSARLLKAASKLIVEIEDVYFAGPTPDANWRKDANKHNPAPNKQTNHPSSKTW